MACRMPILFLLFCLPVLAANAQSLQRFDIVIDEIFPDPNPSVGLPNSSFIELRNLSGREINLHNWKIAKSNSSVSIRIDFLLKADSLVILCNNASAPAFSKFGASIGIAGFPALDNEGDTISLISEDGLLVHSVAYDHSWYQNNLKAEGGWSLEMIDTKNHCAGASNWIASRNPAGGTPGIVNSVDGNNPDEEAPALLRTYTSKEGMIMAVFSEPLEPGNAADPSHFFMNNDIGYPISATALSPLFNVVALQFDRALSHEIIYSLVVSGLRDCKGNEIGIRNEAKAAIPVPAKAGDLLINELLFDPPVLGADYVEYYNAGEHAIELKECYMASRNTNADLQSIKPLSKSPQLLFPGEYIVFTENRNWVLNHYVVKDPEHLFELNALPSLPNDQGVHVLLNQEGTVIDELQYSHKWHYPLITNEEGVALERLSVKRPTQLPENWSSAASLAGYGTPTSVNSQVVSSGLNNPGIWVMNKSFSPDNDGFEDFCMIQYNLDNPGFVANIRIFDAQGRMMRWLTNNLTLGHTGSIRWDGLDDMKKPLPAGAYIILGELFDISGTRKNFKELVFLMKKG